MTVSAEPVNGPGASLTAATHAALDCADVCGCTARVLARRSQLPGAGELGQVLVDGADRDAAFAGGPCDALE